ncbi:hypothetical protein AQUCO_00400483v1 [Aquilegia coerulea]|uniref:Uncharacterized protein n=1 Tax=Aquilegia coerulea TaxID=218851 RepID=A0A2G5EV53_AQUCA|nr:hypothetical protein AQUCO_00400483v1 [Aquilegia coerulea]
MNLSLLIASPSSCTSRPLLLPQFINPSPLRIKNPNPKTCYKQRNLSYRLSITRNSTNDSDSVEQSVSVNKPNLFGGKKELSGIQLLVDNLSPSIRIATSIVIFAASIVAGYGLGYKVGGNKNTGIGGAVAIGAAGSAAVYALNSCVPDVAAVNLHNFVASYDDPTALKSEDIEGIAKRYGVSKQDEVFNAELCELYSWFVTSILPPGGENLKGNEVETIVKFKGALGIDDPDAATVHMEIGRRIFRQRLETGDRESDTEQRRAFQKLIYVSTLVFGKASTFLLPWKRVFKITDSQVEVAVRECAQRLYASALESVGRDVDEKKLISLREAQLQYQLSDELAADMFRERTRKLVEENISTALDVLKSRTRAMGASQVVEELDKIIAFSNHLMSLSNHSEAGRFALGIGPISVLGGEYDSGRKVDDLKLLYRSYVAESFSSGRIEDKKLVALNHLKNIFGLGNKEAEAIMLEVASRAYRRRLSQAVSSGDLEAADSKAMFLQSLCAELHFDPEKASDIHKDIYHKKLQQAVAKGELSEEDSSALLRMRVLLCIPQKTVEAVHADICGSMFEKVVRDAIAAGTNGYDPDTRDSVRKAARGLRLTEGAAMDIASKAVRKMFINYINQAQAAGSSTEFATELKKMIAFNSLIVTELIDDIKGEPIDIKMGEPIDIKMGEPVDIKMGEPVEQTEVEVEEWDLQSLKKTRAKKVLKPKLEPKPEKRSQTEITLKDDLPLSDRTDLYKSFLAYCITGGTKKSPFGSQVQTKTKMDDSEFLLLKQLGVILGLTVEETVGVHRSLAEQAYMKQAEVILADGQLTKGRIDQLSEVQKQVGLPAENAQKIIKSITRSKMASAIETAVSQGRLSIKQIRELKGASVDLDTLISESLRENIFTNTIDEIFSSGTGDFDEEEVYTKIPSDLNINIEKAKGVVHERARTRLANSLIQAVALLRQRNRTGVVSSLNDMLACDKVMPAEPLSWEVPEELADLFAIFQKSDPAPEKLSRLQYLLGISDSTAAALRDSSDILPLVAEEEEFVF